MKTIRRMLTFRWATAGLAIAAVCAGCGRDPRDLPPDMPKKIVLGAFEAYGEQLDEKADPATVTRVWLRAAADYFHANRDNDKENRKAALVVLAKLAAPKAVMAIRRAAPGAKSGNKITLEEAVYVTIRFWVATVSHYIDDVELDKMKARRIKMPALPAGKGSQTRRTSRMRAEVRVPASRPDGDRAVFVVHLVREEELWRVARVVFESKHEARNVTTIEVPLRARAAESRKAPASRPR